jgi:tRNA (guanine-N7-)-methyltransferase
LIDQSFTELVARVLKPGGIIRLGTDWEHYAVQMAETFTAAPGFEPLGTERFAGRVLTAFESKGIREGRAIFDLAFRRA